MAKEAASRTLDWRRNSASWSDCWGFDTVPSRRKRKGKERTRLCH